MTQETKSSVVQVPGFVKKIMRAQAWMIQHGMMGSMSDFVMTITVQGRKSGKEYSTPIAYLRDGDKIIALNGFGRSNWYRNVLVNPEVRLSIKGQPMRARGRHVTDPAEKARIFDKYLSDYPGDFKKLFDIEREASQAEKDKARDTREFIVFEQID